MNLVLAQTALVNGLSMVLKTYAFSACVNRKWQLSSSYETILFYFEKYQVEVAC